MFLLLAGVAGLLAAFFIHWLTWTLRLKTLTLAVILGVISALGLTGFFLLFLNSDIANMVLGAMAVLYAIVFALGYIQARWLRLPWWKGVAALFFETALAFATGAAVNLACSVPFPGSTRTFPALTCMRSSTPSSGR